MPTRKLSHDEGRIVVDIPLDLKRRLERFLTPPGATKPPYGAIKRFFERKIRDGIGEPPAIEEIREALARRIGKSHEAFEPRLREKPVRKTAKPKPEMDLPDSVDDLFGDL